MSDSESTRPPLSTRGKVARCVGWLAIIVVISTTIVPVGYSPRAAALPTSLTLQGALAAVSRKGYDASDYANENVPDEATWDATTLRVLLGVKRSSDSYNQRAFFFLKDRYLGTDTSLPSARISLAAQADTTVTIEYTLYRRPDPMTAPTGGSGTVRYHWNGNKLVPKDPTPPASWSAKLSRRGGAPGTWPIQPQRLHSREKITFDTEAMTVADSYRLGGP
jgi:LppP/LprE lipoprotein